MTSEQKSSLRNASLTPMPICASTTPKTWTKSREAVLRALKGGSLDQGLRGAVFIESCVACDRILVRTPIRRTA